MSGRNLKAAAGLALGLAASGCKAEEKPYSKITVAAEACVIDGEQNEYGVRAELMDPYLTGSEDTVMIPGELIFDEGNQDKAKEFKDMIKTGALRAVLEPGKPAECSNEHNEWGNLVLFDQGVGGSGKVGFAIKANLDDFPFAEGDGLSVTSVMLATGSRDGNCETFIPTYDNNKYHVMSTSLKTDEDASTDSTWNTQDGVNDSETDGASCPTD